MRASRAAAVLDGRDYAVPDDAKGRAAAALRHRITLAPEIEVEGRAVDDVLAAILTRVSGASVIDEAPRAQTPRTRVIPLPRLAYALGALAVLWFLPGPVALAAASRALRYHARRGGRLRATAHSALALRRPRLPSPRRPR